MRPKHSNQHIGILIHADNSCIEHAKKGDGQQSKKGKYLNLPKSSSRKRKTWIKEMKTKK